MWRSKQRPPLGTAGVRLPEVCIAETLKYVRLYMCARMQPRSNGTFVLVGTDAVFLVVATACTESTGLQNFLEVQEDSGTCRIHYQCSCARSQRATARAC